jgi:AAA domain
MELTSSADFLALPDPEWIIEGIIVRGGNHMLFAEEGTGKSQVCLELAYCVAQGKDFLGFPVRKPTMTVYVAAERASLQRKRLRNYGSSDRLFFIDGSVDLDDPVEIERGLDSVNIDLAGSLFIFDTFQACGSLGRESRVLRSYELFRQRNIAMLLIHHPRKLVQGLPKNDPERSCPKAHGTSALTNPQDVRMYYSKQGSSRLLEFTKNNLVEEDIRPVRVVLKDGRSVTEDSVSHGVKVQI